MKKVFAVLFAAFVGVAVLAPTQSADAQPIYSNFCCDGNGVHRCVMQNGPFPIGAACFCYGQGNGVVCP